MFLGHSSQIQPRSDMKVLRSFSNFNHQFVSMKGSNPENFSSIPFLFQFLETFKILQKFAKFQKNCHFGFGAMFRQLYFANRMICGFGQLIFLKSSKKTDQTAQTEDFFGYIFYFISISFSKKSQFCRVRGRKWKNSHFQSLITFFSLFFEL